MGLPHPSEEGDEVVSMTCAICMALGRLPLGPLLPNVVTYRGYSLCMEHMQLWEGCRREDGAPAEWEDVMSFARPKPTETGERLDRAWEAAPADVEELHLYKDKAVAVLPGGEEVVIDDPVTDVIDRVSVPQMDSDYSVGNLEVEVKAVTSDVEEIPLEPGYFQSTDPHPQEDI